MPRNPGPCRCAWEGSPSAAFSQQGPGLLFLCTQEAVLTQTSLVISGGKDNNP